MIKRLRTYFVQGLHSVCTDFFRAVDQWIEDRTTATYYPRPKADQGDHVIGLITRAPAGAYKEGDVVQAGVPRQPSGSYKVIDVRPQGDVDDLSLLWIGEGQQ